MVIKGDALVQVMGDWAKGEFKNANKEAGKDYLCYRFPGTDGAVLYNTDMFAFFQVSADRKAAQTALADSDDEPRGSRSPSTSSRARPRRAWTCRTPTSTSAARRRIADIKAANAKGTFLGSMAQNYAQPPAIATAYYDVVTKFLHGEIKTSDEAVKRARQGDQRREIVAGSCLSPPRREKVFAPIRLPRGNGAREETRHD